VREHRLTRRELLAGAAGVGLTLAAPHGLPSPSRSGLDHIVVLVLENRSFDHLLGWLPGADGKQAGLSYRNRFGLTRSTYPLAPDFQGCLHADPSHTYRDLRIAYNGGRCDGWLLPRLNDRYAIGYYRKQDLPFLGQAAPAWTVCDRYFSPIMGPTLPNRIYLQAGTTDRTSVVPFRSRLPTIWDRLLAAGLAGRYYSRNLPALSLWGLKYLPIMHTYNTFLDDCRAGTLPHLAYVEPKFTTPYVHYGNDDHPPADIRAGETLMNDVYEAVTSSPAWPRTLLVITFDESGGFFDHVAPTAGPDTNPRYTLRGFRVPTLLISPFARRGHVDHTLFDHTSILRLVEWRFGLRPLAPRDAHANNLAAALDFSRRDTGAPRFSVPRAGSPRC
jgi:phospholipase C